MSPRGGVRTWVDPNAAQSVFKWWEPSRYGATVQSVYRLVEYERLGSPLMLVFEHICCAKKMTVFTKSADELRLECYQGKSVGGILPSLNVPLIP